MPEHLHGEIELVKQDDVKRAFTGHSDAIEFLRKIPEEKWSYRYEAGKWTIKSLVQHMIDAEIILCNRALVIARKDKTTPLPSFDGDEYANEANADKTIKEDLISEMEAVQHSSKKLFESFTNDQLNATGRVNDYTIAVNRLCCGGICAPITLNAEGTLLQVTSFT